MKFYLKELMNGLGKTIVAIQASYDIHQAIQQLTVCQTVKNTRAFEVRKSQVLWALNIQLMKSNKSIDKDCEEEVKFTQLPYNHEQTLKLENSAIYSKYRSWLKDNGVIIDPRVRYPSYFGSPPKGLVGISASKPIEKGKAIIAVPYQLLITVDKVRQNKELMPIISNHLAVFNKKDDFALKILVLYVVYELLKGEQSFYYPYFSICTPNCLSGWSNWAAYKLQHRGVVRGLKAMQEEIEKQFMNFLRIFRTNESIFPQGLSNTQYRRLFQKAYSFVTTRAFGWSLPSISLIPLADSLNHGNSRFLNHFVINIDLQKKGGSEEMKFRGKVNLSILKDEFFNLNNDELVLLRKEPKSKQLKFVQKHKEILVQSEKMLGSEGEKSINSYNNRQVRSQQYHILHQQYKAGIHQLKNLHFYESSCSEDNDTDEDEVYERAHRYETYQLDDFSRVITQSRKKAEVKKFWKLYYDNEEDSEEDQMEEPLPPIKNDSLKMDIQEKIFKNEDSSQVESEESQQEDQEFEWMANADPSKSYFIMNTQEIIRQNQQIYNFYGRRSNKFLLLGYNFIIKNNIYDSFAFKVKLDQRNIAKVPASKLVENGNKKQYNFVSRQIRLKRYRINKDLINICRSYVVLWTKKEWKNCRICQPFDRQIELKTLELYQEFASHFQKEYTTSLQEDQEEQKQIKNQEESLAAGLRIEYKKILVGQSVLVDKCVSFLKRWKVGQIQDFQESNMKWVQRTKSYLLSLERATSL